MQSTGFRRRSPVGRSVVGMAAALAVAWTVSAGPGSGPTSTPTKQQSTKAMSRIESPPRKVLIATMVSGYEVLGLPLEKRLERMDSLAAAAAAAAKAKYPGKRLDLIVFPESFLARPGGSMAERAVPMDTIRVRLAACAKRWDCYLIVPAWLREPDSPPRYSNVAILVGRGGEVVGMYRKVHPIATGAETLEDGATPGREFPVFDCDFGRLGIQICWDMSYDDGWAALAAGGAEIIALPSASPQTRRPAMYAVRHRYYVVNATPRDNATVFNPIGVGEASTDKGVLVHQIDLSYALLHWSLGLEEGKALARKYGDKVGYHYYPTEDTGVFWSNDPNTTIGQMARSLGLVEMDAEIERSRKVQDAVRGGPPAVAPAIGRDADKGS